VSKYFAKKEKMETDFGRDLNSHIVSATSGCLAIFSELNRKGVELVGKRYTEGTDGMRAPIHEFSLSILESMRKYRSCLFSHSVKMSDLLKEVVEKKEEVVESQEYATLEGIIEGKMASIDDLLRIFKLVEVLYLPNDLASAHVMRAGGKHSNSCTAELAEWLRDTQPASDELLSASEEDDIESLKKALKVSLLSCDVAGAIRTLEAMHAQNEEIDREEIECLRDLLADFPEPVFGGASQAHISAHADWTNKLSNTKRDGVLGEAFNILTCDDSSLGNCTWYEKLILQLYYKHPGKTPSEQMDSMNDDKKDVIGHVLGLFLVGEPLEGVFGMAHVASGEANMETFLYHLGAALLGDLLWHVDACEREGRTDEVINFEDRDELLTSMVEWGKEVSLPSNIAIGFLKFCPTQRSSVQHGEGVLAEVIRRLPVVSRKQFVRARQVAQHVGAPASILDELHLRHSAPRQSINHLYDAPRSIRTLVEGEMWSPLSDLLQNIGDESLRLVRSEDGGGDSKGREMSLITAAIFAQYASPVNNARLQASVRYIKACAFLCASFFTRDVIEDVMKAEENERRRATRKGTKRERHDVSPSGLDATHPSMFVASLASDSSQLSGEESLGRTGGGTSETEREFPQLICDSYVVATASKAFDEVSRAQLCPSRLEALLTALMPTLGRVERGMSYKNFIPKDEREAEEIRALQKRFRSLRIMYATCAQAGHVGCIAEDDLTSMMRAARLVGNARYGSDEVGVRAKETAVKAQQLLAHIGSIVQTLY